MPDLDSYRQHLLAQGYAAGTVRAKVGAVSYVCADQGVEPAALTVEHVVTYLARRPLATWTRRAYIRHLRAWATWAGLPDPTAGLRMPPAPRAVPRPLGEQELAQLLAVADGEVRTWIVLGAFAGLRSFESAKVRGDDLTQTTDGPVLRVEGKGGHVDTIPAAFVVVRELEAWRRQAGAGRLWPDATPETVRFRITALGRRAGVHATSHMLRHRYGTQLYAASRDLLLTQRLMRHANPNTTAGYAQVADAGAARLVDQLPIPGLRVVDDGAA